MNAFDMLLELKELGLFGILEKEEDGKYYVEDTEYGIYAEVTFDEDGNCIKVE